MPLYKLLGEATSPPLEMHSHGTMVIPSVHLSAQVPDANCTQILSRNATLHFAGLLPSMSLGVLFVQE
jgi:hypothetical protein